MSRTNIPVYAINRNGFFPNADVLGDPTNGMYFSDNDAQTWLEVSNPGTLNIPVGATIYDNVVDGISVGQKRVVAAAGSTIKFGPFPRSYYSQDDTSVYISVDPDLTFGVEGTQLHIKAFTTGG